MKSGRKKNVLYLLGLILLCLLFFLTHSKIFHPVSRKKTSVIADRKTGYSCYLTGEVNKPGVYDFSPGEKLGELLKRAGGVTENADLSGINLEKPLSDGDFILLPARKKLFQPEEMVKKTEAEEKLNLNTCTFEDLIALAGITPQKARAFLKYRQKKGKFTRIEELKEIPGFTEKDFERIKDEVKI